MPDAEAEIDELYRQPLAGFTAARDALAAQRKSAGDKDGAKRIKALSKPSASAWAVNQLHWTASFAVATFVSASRRVLEAQQQAVAAPALRELTQRRRDALNVLVKRALGLLAEAGHAATPAVLGRVSGTLEALAVRAARGEPMTLGRLADDLEPPGLDALDGLTLAIAPRVTAPTEPAAPAAASTPVAASVPVPEPGPTAIDAAAARAAAAAESARRARLQQEAEVARRRRQAEAARNDHAAALVRKEAAEAERAEASKRLERAEARARDAASVEAVLRGTREDAERELAEAERTLQE